jgi:acyl carrier protein
VTQTAPEAQAPVEQAVWTVVAVQDLLTNLISERTGYPPEMLSPDLDLEADLGIDSIKRVEILGLFQQQTGLNQTEHMEDLSKRKTLQALVDFLAVHLGS